MCVGPFRPRTPKLPETPEVAPRPERTAKAPTVGAKRSGRKTASASASASALGTGRRRSLSGRRRGTSSLRIPLAPSGNLNY